MRCDITSDDIGDNTSHHNHHITSHYIILHFITLHYFKCLKLVKRMRNRSTKMCLRFWCFSVRNLGFGGGGIPPPRGINTVLIHSTPFHSCSKFELRLLHCCTISSNSNVEIIPKYKSAHQTQTTRASTVSQGPH